MTKPLCPNCESELIKHTGWHYVIWECPNCAFSEFDQLNLYAA